MTKSSKPFNPFYAMLAVVGVLFAITACAYLATSLRSSDPTLVGSEDGPFAFFDRYGMTVLIVELVLLGMATVGAMVTDEYWMKRAQRQSQE